jgi:hypothetical protein
LQWLTLEGGAQPFFIPITNHLFLHPNQFISRTFVLVLDIESNSLIFVFNVGGMPPAGTFATGVTDINFKESNGEAFPA